MKIRKERIKEDFNRDLYWTKVFLESPEKSRTTVVFMCASWEYLLDQNGTNSITKRILNNWLNSVIEKYKQSGDVIFKKSVHFDVMANTTDGIKNGLDFLMSVSKI